MSAHTCTCQKSFRSLRALWGHQRACAGVAAEELQAEERDDEQTYIMSSPHHADEPSDEDEDKTDNDDDVSLEHNEHSLSRNKRARSVREAAFQGLTRLRLDYNASNAQIEAVKEMMLEVIERIKEKVCSRLESDHNELTATQIRGLLATVGDPFVGMRSSYMEGKLREAKLPYIAPTARVLGSHVERHETEDGREVQEEITDYVYDFDVQKQLEAMFKYNPSTCEDFLGSMARWQAGWKDSSISDTMGGTGARDHPFVREAIRRGKHCLLLQYYMDGLTLTNPLGAAKKRHKIAVSYVAVLNFSPSHRTSPHSIIPVSLCMEKDYSRRSGHGHDDPVNVETMFFEPPRRAGAKKNLRF